MRRQWSTPVLWVVFTALATVIGLGSVSLVRHDVVATSLQPTSAADVSKVLGSAAPSPEATEPASAEPSSTPTPTGSASPSPTRTATSAPQPSRTSTPAPRSTQRETQSPSPRPTPTGSVVSRLFMQPFASAGWIEVRCTGSTTSVVAAAGNPPLYDNPEIGPSDGGFEFAFHPQRDSYPEIQGFVRCDASGQAKWYLSGGSDH